MKNKTARQSANAGGNVVYSKKSACAEARCRITGPVSKGSGRWGLAVDGVMVASEAGTYAAMQRRILLRRIDMARILLGRPGVFDHVIEPGDFCGGRFEYWV